MLWCGGILMAIVYALVFYYLFVQPFNFRWKALYGDVKYPEGYSVQGIDISHYQGDIDWKKLHGASINDNPISFVIIKSTEGNSLIDENFRSNFLRAKEFGFVRGAYHYFVPGVPATEQASHFLRNVHLESGDFPPVLDFEQRGNLTPQQISEEALCWLKIIEAHYNVKPIIYTYYKFKTTYLSDSVFDEYPYWIAHYYVDTLRYKGKWKLWQHTDAGVLDGIKGNVDFNVYNGSMYDLKRFVIPVENDD